MGLARNFDVIHFPAGDCYVDCLWAPVSDCTETLAPQEAESVASAVSIRKHTYSTGRWLAHQALSRLGLDAAPILSGAGREPLWPGAVSGSITHTDEYAAVVVVPGDLFPAIGIDMERMGKLESSLLPKILTGREAAALHPLDPTLIFSAKEACYKLLYPLFGQYVDFQDVEITVDESGKAFAMRYVGDRSSHRVVESALGLIEQKEDHWLTLAVLPRRAVESAARRGETESRALLQAMLS